MKINTINIYEFKLKKQIYLQPAGQELNPIVFE